MKKRPMKSDGIINVETVGVQDHALLAYDFFSETEGDDDCP